MTVKSVHSLLVVNESFKFCFDNNIA